ncbi:MAG: ABC transporter permease [Ilumatobacteraceae bacterium]
MFQELREQIGGRLRILYFVTFGFCLISIARVVTDAPGISSSGTFRGAIGLATPVAMAGIAGLISERAGVVNIGLQGMMVLGTWGAGFFGWQFGPWGALFGGALFGALGGALHALNTVYFGVDHAISGVAINLLAPGVARFLSGLIFVGNEGGTLTDSPPVGNLGKFSMPVLAGGRVGNFRTMDILDVIEKSQFFLISDVAGLFGGLLRNIAIETGLMLLLIPVVSYVLWKTPFGLRLRASGEKPSAAESLGVDVVKTRWIALVSSGMLAGLGGAWLVTNIGKYQQGQEGLRGFLGLASVIFGNWKPSGVLVGSVLFQFTESVRLQIGDEPSLAFVFAVGLVATSLGVMRFRKRSLGSGFLFLLLATGIMMYYLSVERVDDKLSATFPYLITLLVLIFSSKRLRPPASIGLPWTRGQED